MTLLEPNVKNEEVKKTGRPMTEAEKQQEQIACMQRIINELIMKSGGSQT